MNKWKLVKKRENQKITFWLSWNPEKKKERKKTNANFANIFVSI